MKQFLYKIFIYAIVCIIISNLIAVCSYRSLKNSDMFKPSFLIRHYPSGSNFDYIVLGASTAHSGLDTELMDSTLQTEGLNIAMIGMGYSAQQMMLEHFIAHGLQTKYCIIDINSWLIQENNAFSADEFYFLPFVNNDYVYHSFKNREPEFVKIRTYSKYFPILGLAYYNQQLFFSSLIAAVQPHHRHNFNEKGNMVFPPHTFFNYNRDVKYDTIAHLGNPFLNIERICRENDIQLIWHIPPRCEHNSVVDSGLSKSRIIINNEHLFNGEEIEYMADFVHVNSIGRDKATIALCDSLIKKQIIYKQQ